MGWRDGPRPRHAENQLNPDSGTGCETCRPPHHQILSVDLHPEVTRVFHRELTRLKVMFCGLCWGQDMRGLPFCFGYC